MFQLECNWKNGFMMDPMRKDRVGYLVEFEGLGLTAAKDVEVYCPFNATPTYSGLSIAEDKATVVGVIESFNFNGGVGDPISISAYVSTENATQILGLLKSTIKTNKVTKLAYWIGNFDQEGKVWYEEAYPKAPDVMAAQINSDGGGRELRLAVAPDPVRIAPHLDVTVMNVYFEVVPAANSTYALHFASSAAKNFIRNWGLKVGTAAAAAMQ